MWSFTSAAPIRLDSVCLRTGVSHFIVFQFYQRVAEWDIAVFNCRHRGKYIDINLLNPSGNFTYYPV
jgi:hypothetical protein